MSDLGDHLRRHYAIEEPLRLITGAPSSGPRNAALQAGNWFVKRFAASRVPEPLVEQSLRVQEAMRTLGIPAPQVLRSQDGSLYTSFDDQYVAVMEFVPGRSLVPGCLTPAQAGVAGEVLARLHGALAQLAPDGSGPLPLTRESILAEWGALRQAAATSTACAELNRFVAEAAAYREAALQSFPLPANNWAGQPWQLIHGDYHVGNLRWDDQDAVLAVLDFDGCGAGYVACEVAEAWLRNCRTDPEVPAPEAEAAFLLGYCRHGQLSRAQWLAIPHIWWAKLAAQTWPVSEVYERPGSYDADRALQVALKRERQVRWVESHLAEMVALLQQAWDDSGKPEGGTVAHAQNLPPDVQVTESAGQREAWLAAEKFEPRALVIEEHTEIWHRTLPAGLRAIGCRVAFDTEVIEGDLERTILAFQPDFAVMMGWTQTHTPQRRRVVRRLLDRYRVPLVYWAVEDAEWLETWSLPLVRDLRPDLVVTINADCIGRYKAEGFRAGYLPFGCNPEIHCKVAPRPEYDCDIALVANFYAVANFPFRERALANLVKPLLERGYDLKIWGKGWERAPEYGLHVPERALQGSLSYQECAAVYSSARMVLGPQNNLSATQFTMRTCEVLGSGGLLLTSDTPAVRNLFAPGRHLLVSDSPERTVQLVDYYLAHEEERQRVAAAGQAEAYARHTYAERAWGLLGLLETGGA